ncbi:hypothetical protein ACFPFP_40850 [Bradyrhizobium sp. GCM10023182]|uniref:Tat pathway signal sequence domain protein n=1 Tax=Bradyrhizobium zhengyangense TaxID=2911009 RepID=A0ABS9M2R7_9BRAD|nr:hypothetical protein [Bradyrhizobium zhengyangense]MCG2673212.1 hypothetical protein [Bradyrhizobium zhengyangense]
MDRRTFLKSSSAISLLSMFSDTASAFAAKSLSPSVTSLTSSVTTGAPLNNGRSQINLNFLQIGGDFPFLNCLKNAQSWTCIDNSGLADPSLLDSDGYPTSIAHGGVYTVFDVPTQSDRPGNYVITWSGNGTIWCGMSNTLVSGSKTSTSGSGRYVFSTTDSRFVVGISAIGSPRITNLRVFHVNDETALNAGQVFGARFKQRLMEANFGVVRFMNWQAGNTTNVTTWATRKPTSYVFYAGQEFRKSLYAGLTRNVGSAYAVDFPNFRLADKATVIVKFNVSNTTPCTLNVNGTGDINILNHYSAPLSSGNYPIGGTWQSIATLVYDATLNAWIKQGGDAALGSAGLSNGCPPELMVQLCIEIGAHPYFVTPALAIDPATDYMPSLAAYCRANAPSWMVPRFEGPNETWNNASGFYSTAYAKAKATAYGWGPDVHNWYGKVMSVLGQAISAVYAGDRTKYQVLCGVQTALGTSTSGTATCNARLASTRYLAQSAPAQASYTKTAASAWVTHICTAQYFTPSEYGTTQEALDAQAFVAATDPSVKASIAAAYANTANSGSGPYTLARVALMHANWKVWALSFGIKHMCGYEGGYSPDYTSRGTSAVDLLRSASKWAPSVSNLTTINYNNFVGLTDANFVAEFPSCFQLSGRAPSNNAWALLETIYASAPPQWGALVAFNH